MTEESIGRFIGKNFVADPLSSVSSLSSMVAVSTTTATLTLILTPTTDIATYDDVPKDPGNIEDKETVLTHTAYYLIK